jgi:hypothetical protein
LEKLALVLKHLRADAGDTLLAVARLELAHQRLMTQLRRDCAKSKPGSIVRLHYLRAIGAEIKAMAELKMSLGYYPRQMGVQVRENYSFTSRVTLGGDTKVMDDSVPYTQADFPADRQLSDGD